MSADQSLCKRGNRLATMIEIGCPPTLISLPCTNSLPPLYATPPHGSYATPLRRFSFPHLLLRHRVVAVKPALSRVRSYAQRSRSRSAVTIAFPPPPRRAPLHIIKGADQQASVFLHRKLKVGSSSALPFLFPSSPSLPFLLLSSHKWRAPPHRRRHLRARWGDDDTSRCLEAATGPEERCKIVACMRGRIADLPTNCYGYHVLQKALDCKEEEICLLIVSEVLRCDPATTLVNKHASHVLSKITEISWARPAPPIFAYVNKSLKGNLEESAKDGIVDELLAQSAAVFAEVAKSQWSSYCMQHILEHGSEKHRQVVLEHLLTGLLEFATNEEGSKSVVNALKEGGKETLDRVVQRMCEPAKGARRAMIVDLALSLTGSQLIASVLPTADKDQRAALYDCIRGHTVTLRGCKSGSKVTWHFDRMRAYYGY
ncbi:armadillo-type protein [Mycena olivaceomarginata]|nr:armadillo-type protein [Mycena olivaceomarginata]